MAAWTRVGVQGAVWMVTGAPRRLRWTSKRFAGWWMRSSGAKLPRPCRRRKRMDEVGARSSSITAAFISLPSSSTVGPSGRAFVAFLFLDAVVVWSDVMMVGKVRNGGGVEGDEGTALPPPRQACQLVVSQGTSSVSSVAVWERWSPARPQRVLQISPMW